MSKIINERGRVNDNNKKANLCTRNVYTHTTFFSVGLVGLCRNNKITY